MSAVFGEVFVHIQSYHDANSKSIAIPAKFKDQEQMEDMMALGFDQQLNKLNIWIQQNIGDYYIDDKIEACEDITEQYQRELELTAAKEIWERTFDSVPDLIKESCFSQLHSDATKNEILELLNFRNGTF